MPKVAIQTMAQALVEEEMKEEPETEDFEAKIADIEKEKELQLQEQQALVGSLDEARAFNERIMEDLNQTKTKLKQVEMENKNKMRELMTQLKAERDDWDKERKNITEQAFDEQNRLKGELSDALNELLQVRKRLVVAEEEAKEGKRHHDSLVLARDRIKDMSAEIEDMKKQVC